MRRVVSVFLMALAIVLAGAPVWSGSNASAASAASRDVWVGSYDGTTLVPGACLSLAPYSNLGCDVNGDGYVTFKAIPDGTYTIAYTSVPAGYLLPAPVTASVYGSGSVLRLGVALTHDSGVMDVHVVALDAATGQRLTGACFTLRGYSNVGCDVNRDGQVDFADIPYGAYTIDLERAPRGTHLVSSPGDLYVLVDPLNSGSDQAYFTVEFGR